jgi:hypothetical protein
MGGVIDTIVNVVTSFIGWLIPIPDIPDFDTPEEERGVLINKQSNNAQIPIVYGRRQVGITRVFIESSGTDNQYLYIAGVVCEGEIEEIEQIFVDDKRVIFDGDLTHGTVRNVSGGDINFYKDGKSYIQIQAFNGTEDQVASSILTPSTNWTSNHRLRGICYIALRLEWNQDIFGSIPQVRVTLKGKKIYDPRDASTAYSSNSALILLDYLRNTRYGKGLPNSAFESDFASFKTSADESDVELVPRTVTVTPLAGLKRQDFNGYYNDYPSFFLNKFPTSESTITSISGITTSPNTSDRYFGYINPTSTTTYEFKTTSDDASHVYIGDAGQTVDSLFKQVQANKSTKLIVNNGGWHGTQTQSGSKSLTSGQQYPIIIYYGNAPTQTTMTFEWRESGGTYSTSLSSIFSNGENITDEVPAITKFETNAVIDTGQKVIENVKKILNPMRALFTYNNGVYKLKIEDIGSIVKTITVDHVIGGAKVLGERKNNKYNRVIGTYVNGFKNWQNDTVSFPPTDDTNVESAFKHSTMLAEDNGTLLEGNFQFPNVTNSYTAEALCEVILRRSRNQLQIQLTLTSEFLELAIGDIVGITYPSGGFNNKPFRVLGLEINEDLTVNVQLFEHQDNFYTFNEKNAIPTIADTILPNPNSVQAPASITLSDDLVEYNDGTVITRLNVLIGASTDQFIDQYEVELRQDTDRNGVAVVDDFKVVGRGVALRHQVLNVIDNATYTIRVRGINALGVKSTFVTAQRQIVGQTAVPQDVEDFAINVIGDQALLSWSAIPDLDLDYYTIRFSTDLLNPSWANSFDLVDRVGRPATNITLPLKTGSYLIKANDKLGNQSANETIILTNIASVNFVNQTTINEHTSFSGTKTDTSVTVINSTNYLGLTATGTVGDNATRVPAEGFYEFSNTIDLGAKFKAQFTATISQITEDVSEFFDGGRPDATTLFDDGRPNPFDGTAPAQAHTILQISTSDDNVTYSAYKQFVTGEHIGRYFKFRVKFTSNDTKARSLISELSVNASLSKRVESGNDISSGTGGKAITFDAGFKLNPAIGISAQSMANGDYYSITSKSNTGFTIEFFNSSATSIDRSFDYIAQGVGQIIT